jgi:hypothetical protein
MLCDGFARLVTDEEHEAMNGLSRRLRMFVNSPRYTLMRGFARFAPVRSGIAWLTRWLAPARRRQWETLRSQARPGSGQFPLVDTAALSNRLTRDGIATGLLLPASTVRRIVDHAMARPCFADRREDAGFMLHEHAQAQARMHKTILLAQYFNSASECGAIGELTRDPALLHIAGRFLGTMPRFVGANLWWTFPVAASEEDRHLHAHLFHRDVDDFRFVKFFFYLTDVGAGEGGHVCVRGSHRRPPGTGLRDRWRLRRYSDEEIARTYLATDILEIVGPAGTGFAENTLCVHKGLTPKTQPRLLLQLQFALFDYGVMHDRRSAGTLKMLALA